MTAIELSHWKQIHRRGQETEPGGPRHRVHVERIAVWNRTEEDPADRAKQQRLAQFQTECRHRLWQADDVRKAYPDDKRWHQHKESGDRARHADVEQDPLVLHRLTN